MINPKNPIRYSICCVSSVQRLDLCIRGSCASSAGVLTVTRLPGRELGVCVPPVSCLPGIFGREGTLLVAALTAGCGGRRGCTILVSSPRSGTYLPFGPGPHRVTRLVLTFATRTDPSASTVTLQGRVDLPMLPLPQLSNCLTLKGSLSAVSKPKFARLSKYALESSRRDLQNALLCTVCTVL